MLNRTKLTLACALLTCMPGGCLAQSEGAKYFHLDFAVKELDGGKVTNARHYWTTITTGEHPSCSIRTGSKVPVETGEGANSQWTYLDLGVSVDCRNVQETDGNLSLNVTAEISSAASTPGARQPVIRQNKWNGMVLVPLGKATLIFASDDPASKGQVQVDLTATPVR